MIYEGMSISIRSNGNYEVRYQIEAPIAEITLRMQLHFQTTCGKTGTITLAPVHIHEEREEDRNVSSQSFLIVQRGNSETLRRAYCQLVTDLSDDAVPAVTPFSRTGTARFGAVPQK